MRRKMSLILVCGMPCLLVAAAPGASTAPSFVLAPATEAEDPPFRPQRLVLRRLPKAVGPSITLFNGKDLNDWDTWLGYADPAETYRANSGKPLGTAYAGGTFNVVTEDGMPALRVSGKLLGALTHKGDFGDYHLRLEYKWGKARGSSRADRPANSGLLYHSFGQPGVMFGTWMKSVEFALLQGSSGKVVPVAPEMRIRTSVAVDRSVIDPRRSFMLGGRDVEIRAPARGVEAGRDAERPAGRWNRLDLYVLGDKAIHVVNGAPVMMVHGIATGDAQTGSTPLTHGRIQIQSEGSEVYFRNIVLQPIDRLPIVMAR
ncbi:DUF1080 domain-containing protein [Sphingopyxis sp.]|jgi:hypothetical protein|uniref:3-keto-disaccharide hydrolase n=1 Tax=Sphingopyxis sp. TaxID=1908224 RepID=UPI002DEE53AD|nr:DUF1080 domain-containing protein [Sphingopyxis sp.]